MMPQGNSDHSKPLALHNGLKCAYVRTSVGVCTVCMHVHGYVHSRLPARVYVLQHELVRFTEKDCHQLLLCNIPLPVHLITKVITKGAESGI